MKKLLFTLIAATLIFSGCNKKEQFKVTVNLDNSDNHTVYFFKDVEGVHQFIDSVAFKDNQVVLKADFDDPQTCYILKFDPTANCGIYTFFTENQNTTITGNLQELERWKVEGCPSMAILTEYQERSLTEFGEPIMALYEEMGAAYEADDTVRAAEIDAQIDPLVEAYYEDQKNFIRTNSDNYIGHFLLAEAMRDYDLGTVKELYEGFTNESMYSKRVKEFIDKYGRVEIGQPFIDFTLQTADGTEINLAQVINNNKVTLVDFWASWCGPCRMENPHVKAAYEKYHDAGLEIIGVSVDRDEAAWLNAVEADGLSWTQVRDTDNSVAMDYMVMYIPSNYLYDANGVMIAKGLRGEELEAKLAEVLQ